MREAEAVLSLIYASRATSPVAGADLVTLLTGARRHNAAAGVTGLLLYAHESFLQVLEGEEAVVLPLYERISADPRHDGLRKLAQESVGSRRFVDWSMGFAHPDDLALAEDLPGFTPAVRYPLVDPELVLNGTVAERLLTLYARNAGA